MKLFPQLAEVELAQARVRIAREELGRPLTSLMERSDRHPLGTVGVAAGVGFALGSLNLHPLRVPGVGPLLGGGLADAAAFATRWLVEEGLEGFGHGKRSADEAGDTNSTESAESAEGRESEAVFAAKSQTRERTSTP